MTLIEYPTARRADVQDVLHGKTVKVNELNVAVPRGRVKDPYRWMEDLDAEETKQFVDAQNAITRTMLEECPYREAIRRKLTTLWNYPKFTAPVKKGNYYFFHKNDGLQNQSVMYRKEGLHGMPEIFLDPNTLSKDGTIALTVSAFSENGTYYCYGLSEAGSDWSSLKIKDVKTKKDLPEKLERFRYSAVAWTKDELGFFYGQYSDWTGRISGNENAAAMNQKLYYHRLNTPQSKDVLCVEFTDHPTWRMSPRISECGNYLIVTVMEGCKDKNVYVADISEAINGLLPLQCIYDTFDCQLNYVTNDGTSFYFHTNKDRPNYGVVKLDLSQPDEWVEVIPQHERNVLEWATCVNGNKLVLAYLKDVTHMIQVHNLNTGKLLQVLPLELGTISGMTGERKYSEVFFSFTSFLTPGTIFRCEIDKAPHAILKEYQKIKLNGFTTEDLTAKQVFYESKDGTRIPMFIVQKKICPQDGNAPCLLFVHGGFNIVVQPAFSAFKLMLLKAFGFRVAVANVRGGGEYGVKWHNAGRLANKQNTFDDVHAAAKFLIQNKYTRASRLVLMGVSNGGMVTTACINQKPDLFGAAVVQLPVTDMFRFHKFTVGNAWCSDYGNPDKAEDFIVQAKYSPLHNVPTNVDNFPSLLVVTADHDDRVVPSHALKYIAEVQYKLGAKNKKPLLALIDMKAGHGGKPTSKMINEFVDIMCFLYRELKLNYDG